MKNQRMTQLTASLLFCVTFVCGSLQADLTIEYGESGLKRLEHNGKDILLIPGSGFHLAEVKTADSTESSPAYKSQISYTKPGSEKHLNSLLTKFNKIPITYQENTNSYVQTIDGVAEISVRYHKVGDARLDIIATVKNKMSAPMGYMKLDLLALSLPNFERGTSEVDNGYTGHLFSTLESEGNKYYFVNREFSEPMRMYIRNYNGDIVLSVAPRLDHKAIHPVIDDHLFDMKGRDPLPPGKSWTFRVSIYVAPESATKDDLATLIKEPLAAYHQAFPQVFTWPDRRPIATDWMCHPWKRLPKNPMGWFNADAKLDMTTPEGQKEFGERLLKRVDENIERMKKLDHQGIIVWELLGAEFYHPVTWLGDPSRIKEVAPVMDRYADEMFSRYRKAGLRVGTYIRPTEIYKMPDDDPRFLPHMKAYSKESGRPFWFHKISKNPVQHLIDKIEYCKKRWGMTLFYIDTNTTNVGVPVADDEAKKAKGVPGILPAHWMKALHEAHPDCLIWGEHEMTPSYAFSSFLKIKNVGQTRTTDHAQLLYPKAFSCVIFDPTSMLNSWEDYVNGRQYGDILCVPIWYPNQEQILAQAMYKAAEWRKQIPATMSAAEINKTLTGEDAFENYRTLRYIVENKVTTDPKHLLPKLDSTDPLIMRTALLALRHCEIRGNDEVLDVLWNFTFERPLKGNMDKDAYRKKAKLRGLFQPVAAETLGHVGEKAVTRLLPYLDISRKKGEILSYVTKGAKLVKGAQSQNPELYQRILAITKSDDAHYKQLSKSYAEALRYGKNGIADEAMVEILNGDNMEAIYQTFFCANYAKSKRTAYSILYRMHDRPAALSNSVLIYSWLRVAVEAFNATTGNDFLNADQCRNWWKSLSPEEQKEYGYGFGAATKSLDEFLEAQKKAHEKRKASQKNKQK